LSRQTQFKDSSPNNIICYIFMQKLLDNDKDGQLPIAAIFASCRSNSSQGRVDGETKQCQQKNYRKKR
ncbi:MAG: hypothetical protein ACRDBM_15235, partial [Sporomusa sp.]